MRKRKRYKGTMESAGGITEASLDAGWKDPWIEKLQQLFEEKSRQQDRSPT